MSCGLGDPYLKSQKNPDLYSMTLNSQICKFDFGGEGFIYATDWEGVARLCYFGVFQDTF